MTVAMGVRSIANVITRTTGTITHTTGSTTSA